MVETPSGNADDLREFMLKKVSHEMRAPLAAIDSIIQAVMEGATALTPEHRRMLQRARLRAGTLLTLVDDLRRYWRVEGGTFQPRQENLKEIVEPLLELFEPRAREAGLTISGRCESCLVYGDQELLRELATNLLTNAIQYTPKGGLIDVQLAPANGLAQLAVADTGIGIGPEARKHLFQEFYRAAEAKAVFPEGTGMGLSIVRRIVEMHSGKIEARPREGGGTIFEVKLPLALPIAD